MGKTEPRKATVTVTEGPGNRIDQDAARYRWLRDEADGNEWESIGHTTTPETTDAAIDAAMARRDA